MTTSIAFAERCTPAPGVPVLLKAMTGCTRPDLSEARRYGGASLRAPGRIGVADLGALPEDVWLDQGVRERLIRSVPNEPPDVARLGAARRAPGAVAEKRRAAAPTEGLPAERATTLPPPLRGPSVVNGGPVMSVGECNRTRRTIIGFGRRAGSVPAELQAWYHGGGVPLRMVDSLAVRATRPRMPGGAGTMGAGAVAGTTAASAVAPGILQRVTEACSADTGAGGRRIGDALALRLGRLFAERGPVPVASAH